MYEHELVRLPFGDSEILLYAPTLGKVWKVPLANDPGTSKVNSDVPVEVSKPHVDLTFLISFACNLACTYCYEAHGNSPQVLSISGAKAIGERLLARHVNHADRFVGNFFGGEPTLFPEFLREMAQWIRAWGEQNQRKVVTTITTNGHITAQTMPLLWQVADRVKVSFDGIRKVQDQQRPLRNGGSSYDGVLQALDTMASEHSERLTLRLTVTAFSLPFLAETAAFLCNRYPGVPQQYEPAMDSCFAAEGVADFSMRAFVDQFLEANRIGLAKATPIGTSFARISRFNSDVNRFCGVSSMKYTILPDGSLASCNRVHTSTVRQTPFYLGTIDEVMKRQRPQYQLPFACKSCFARFACKGGCYALRHSLQVPDDEGFSFCDEIRRLLTGILELHLQRKEVTAIAADE